MDRDIVETLCRSLPDVIAVYRFGSAGTPMELKQSDMDIAFLAGAPLPVAQVWAVGEEIATLVGRDVDLVDLRRASTVMRAQVILSGRRIFCFDCAVADEFETMAYSAYALLNEERREILDAISARGAIHG